MNWSELLPAAGFLLLGYLFGSLAPSVWITRMVKGVDVRNVGSGHATATNTVRQAGFGWGALVLAADLAKGYVPTFLAHRFAPADWMVPLTAMAVVIGHCWPLFAQFRGGMGLASSGGCLLAVEPRAFLVGLGILVSLVLLIRHSARASVFTGLLMAPAFWLLGWRGLPFWTALAVGAVVAYRFLIDWNGFGA